MYTFEKAYEGDVWKHEELCVITHKISFIRFLKCVHIFLSEKNRRIVCMKTWRIVYNFFRKWIKLCLRTLPTQHNYMHCVYTITCIQEMSSESCTVYETDSARMKFKCFIILLLFVFLRVRLCLRGCAHEIVWRLLQHSWTSAFQSEYFFWRQRGLQAVVHCFRRRMSFMCATVAVCCSVLQSVAACCSMV